MKNMNSRSIKKEESKKPSLFHGEGCRADVARRFQANSVRTRN